MADIYFGDGYTNGTNGDWNTVGNWYSSQGYNDEGPSPGTPLGRLPTTSDVVYLLAEVTTNTPANWSGNVVFAASYGLYPTGSAGKISSGTWSGTISGGGVSFISAKLCEIAGGTFTSTLNFTDKIKISGSPVFNGPVAITTNLMLVGGSPVFNAAVTLNQNALAVRLDDGYSGNGASYEGGISGGTFNAATTANGIKITGTPAFNAPLTVNTPGGTASVNSNNTLIYGSLTRIAGGTYTPPATVRLIKSGGFWTLDTSTLPKDPGFKQGGGTFAPIITLAGLPDILGAGL